MNSNFYPKKYLGQNFLTDSNIKTKIINACNLTLADSVLEIGPGLGVLTREIANSVKKVWAVEKDKKLFEFLKEDLKDFKNLNLVNEDILKFNLPENKIKVIGNIPYNITSPIIEHLINRKDKITSIFITIQKEVAERIVADPGSKVYGSFSIFTQYYTEPQIKFIIKKGSFKPVPKVDSCFVELKIREKPAVLVKDEKLFFEIIHTAFQQRRKMISNTLKKYVSANKISQIGINPNSRPEELSIEEFAKIEEFVVK